jgi:hypothetical protein
LEKHALHKINTNLCFKSILVKHDFKFEAMIAGAVAVAIVVIVVIVVTRIAAFVVWNIILNFHESYQVSTLRHGKIWKWIECSRYSAFKLQSGNLSL